jgi:hypothetical protein
VDVVVLVWCGLSTAVALFALHQCFTDTKKRYVIMEAIMASFGFVYAMMLCALVDPDIVFDFNTCLKEQLGLSMRAFGSHHKVISDLVSPSIRNLIKLGRFLEVYKFNF